MLVRLYGKNYRSLKGDFELSMVAADLKRSEDRDRGVIEIPVKGESEPLRLLRVVGLFGPNASGKSSVLLAANALNWLVTESSERSRPGSPMLSYEPFLLDKATNQLPIELGCDVIHKGSILRYKICFDAKAIQHETMSLLTGAGEIKLIDRQGTAPIGGKLIKSSPANGLYVEGMQPNVSVLSKLAQHGPQKGASSAQPYYQAIRNATQFKQYSNAAENRHTFMDPDDMRFVENPQYQKWIMEHLMRVADVGICDVNATRKNIQLTKEFKESISKLNPEYVFPDVRVIIKFIHEGEVNRAFDLAQESSGTRKLFNIANDLYTLAHKSITLFADELSASLHPRLLDRLIRAVNDNPNTNAHSQLIFATHDTGLLDNQNGLPPALRRDQVYFTQKKEKGVTELYSLTEFKDDARPVHNIRKRYLSGLYGAIPLVEKLSL